MQTLSNNIKKEGSGEVWIRTYTGGKVYFFEPEKSEINIMDVAHALSLLCRFNGAVVEPYNVAHHSCIVACEVYRETESKSLALSALLHDASEAFISDIPSPFKAHFPGFKEIEIKMEEWLSKRFRFEYPFKPIIKKHDLKALSTEMRDLMNICDSHNLPEPYLEKINPLGWRRSREFFLELYKMFGGV